MDTLLPRLTLGRPVAIVPALFVLTVILWGGRTTSAGYVARRGTGSTVAYGQVDANGVASYRIFPNRTSVIPQDYEYFFSELNFRDVNDLLLAGAADRLYLLDKDLSVLDYYTWETESTAFSTCEVSSDNSLFSCRNHIRVYKKFPTNDSLLLVCGTQGDSAPQQCRTVVISSSSFGNDSTVITPPTEFLSPYPEFPGFGEFINRDSSDDRFFSAGFPISGNQFSLSYFNVSAITNTLQVARDFSNDPSNNRWLNYPGTLVDYYRADYPPIGTATNIYDYQFYFVFLRESIVDNMFDIVYSRVVRICRNDPGSANGDYFTTYMKARIYCEREVPPGRQFTGTIDYQYNEISSVVFNEDGRYSESGNWVKLMYGAFTGPTIGPPGTALCAYRADNSILGTDAGFNRGVFDIFREDLIAPNGEEVENLFVECNPAGRSDTDAQKVQAVQVVTQIGENPLLILDGIVVTQMVLDRVCVVRSTGDGTICVNQDVLFLGTDTGRIMKVIFATNLTTGDIDPVVAEEITLDDSNDINQLSIEVGDDQSKYLFVNTFSKIYRLPLERCNRHQSCNACIGSRDPYCVWDTSSLRCNASTLIATADGTGAVETNLKQNVHTGEITSLCDFPTIEFASPTYTANEDDPFVNLIITSSVAGEAASGLLELYTQDNTATVGTDYNSTVQDVNFDPGTNQTTVSIPLIADSIYEGSEFETFTVSLRMTGRGGVIIGTVGIATVTLIENDFVTVEFESVDLTVSEGDGYTNISLIKAGQSTVATTVLFNTMDGGALANLDYLTTQLTVTFEPSQTRYSVIVPLLSDSVLETTETFRAILTLPSGGSSGVQLGTNNVSTITITDDDDVSVQFSAIEYTATEGSNSCVWLTINKTGDSIDEISFIVQVTPMATGNADLDTTSQTINISSSQTQAQVCINITDDNIYESLETYTVQLSVIDVLSSIEDGVVLTNPVSLVPQGRLVIGTNSVSRVTIMDDDNITVEFGSSSALVNESVGAFYDLVVVKQGVSEVPISVSISTLNQGGSTPVSDYSIITGQVITIDQSEQNTTHRLYITNDNTVEDSEEIIVQLSLPLFNALPRVSLGGITIFNVTVLDDDAVTVGFAESSMRVSEAGSNFTVMVVLNGYSDISLEVNVNSVNGTAEGGSDYILVNQTLQFAPGQTQQSLIVQLVNDERVEADEMFMLQLSSNNPRQLMLGRSNVSVTIGDDDSAQVSFEIPELTVNINESVGMFEVIVVREGESDIDVSVQLEILGSTAAAPLSESVISGQLITIDQSEQSTTHRLYITDDNTVEDSEEFVVRLVVPEFNVPPRVTLGGISSFNLTVLDDDTVTVGFADSSMTVSEAGSNFTVMVVLNGYSDICLDVNVYSVDGTAEGGSDYLLVNQTLQFAPGQTQQPLLVQLVNDERVEADEMFMLQLSSNNPRQVLLGRSNLSVTIGDNDSAQVSFEISELTVNESVGMFEVMVAREGESDIDVRVQLEIVGSTAAAPLSESVISGQLITIDQSEQSTTHRLYITNDNTVEDSEEVIVRLAIPEFNAPPRVTLGETSAFNLTVLDDDAVTVGFAESSIRVSEAGSNFTVMVVLNGYSDITLEVNVNSVNGTAEGVSDFILVNQTLQFALGQTQQPLIVQLVNDERVEADEMFVLQLSSNNPQVLLGRSNLSVTIGDDDSVQVSFEMSELTVNESVGMLEVMVAREGESDIDISVQLEIVGTTAAAPRDFTVDECGLLVILPTVNSVVCRISIVDDDVLERREEFRVQLITSQLRVVASGNTTLDVVILDNDDVSYGLSPLNYTVNESDCFATFMIARNGSSDVPITLLVSTTNGPNSISNALPNDDYVPLDRSIVTFSSDDAYQTVTINLIDDQIVQGTRSFGVALEVDNTANLFPDRTDEPILVRDGLATVYINDDDTMTTDCPTVTPPTSTNIVNENTQSTASGIIPGVTSSGPNVGALGSNIYTSAVDSGVVLGFLLFVIIALMVIVLVLLCLLCRMRRTEKMSKQSLIGSNDVIHPSNDPASGMVLPGIGMRNQFYRENSTVSSVSVLKSPTTPVDETGTSTFDFISKENLASITEEATDGNAPGESSKLPEAQNNSQEEKRQSLLELEPDALEDFETSTAL